MEGIGNKSGWWEKEGKRKDDQVIVGAYPHLYASFIVGLAGAGSLVLSDTLWLISLQQVLVP